MEPKGAEAKVTCDLFAFLTTDPYREVNDVRPKAMPVILTSAEQADAWLYTSWPDVCRLQRPLPDGTLRVVARSGKENAFARPLLPI